jgi:hypothetical protein
MGHAPLFDAFWLLRRQQLALYQMYHNFCLPHGSLHQPLAQPESNNGTRARPKRGGLVRQQWRRG